MLAREQSKRVNLQTAGAGKRFDLRTGRADEPYVDPSARQAETEMKSRDDRTGTTTLVEHLHD